MRFVPHHILWLRVGLSFTLVGTGGGILAGFGRAGFGLGYVGENG